jgi:outer membrane protein OmpA-like peptidoglycan-associated protein
MKLVCAIGTVLTAAVVVAAPPETARIDRLDFASGALLVSASSEYGGGWAALRALDGGTEKGWCSEGGTPLPHTLVIELDRPYALKAIAVDNSGAQDDGYPGISSRAITVYGSTESAAAGFVTLTSFEAPRGGRKEVTLPQAAAARWLKFVIGSNWGNEEYTEMMELEGYGEPVGPAPTIEAAGTYETTFGLMRLEQDGSKIRGCYDYRGGQLDGTISGRVLQLQWREEGENRTGGAIFVVQDDGALSGVYYQSGQLQGEWEGPRAKPNQRAECTIAEAGLAAMLDATGKALIYGIYFDPDSAVPKPESQAALEEILSVLQAKPGLKLLVAGYTDSTNTDAYNLKLSQQRAEAVVAWLVGREVAPARLVAKGFGEAQPVADNATAAGRALNRRVELVVQK